jgi:hypothetical protein
VEQLQLLKVTFETNQTQNFCPLALAGDCSGSLLDQHPNKIISASIYGAVKRRSSLPIKLVKVDRLATQVLHNLNAPMLA